MERLSLGESLTLVLVLLFGFKAFMELLSGTELALPYFALSGSLVALLMTMITQNPNHTPR